MNALWLLPILGSLGGYFFLYLAIFDADGAPKQAAAAALAAAMAVIPYVLTRSIQTIRDNGPSADDRKTE